MKIILLSLLFFTAITAYSQEHAYKFRNIGSGSFKLIELDTLGFETYIKQSNGVKQRNVITSNANYRFILKKTKEGKIQEITDETGKVLGKVMMAGNGKYDVILESGQRYKWRKIDGRSWSYEYNGNVVLKGTYQKEASVKKIVSTSLSDQIPEILLISSLERGGDVIAAKASTGPMILVAILTAAVAQATR